MEITRRLSFMDRTDWPAVPLGAPWDDEPDKAYGRASDGRLVVLYRTWRGSWQACIETRPGGLLHHRSHEQARDLIRDKTGHDEALDTSGYATSRGGDWERFCLGFHRKFARGLGLHPWMIGFVPGVNDTIFPNLYGHGDPDGTYTTMREALARLEHFRTILEKAE